MLVVLPFCSKDKHLAIQLAEWIQTLGGVKAHECMLVHPPTVDTDGLLEPLRIAFSKLFILRTPDDRDGWPQGPNLLFRRTARQIEATSPQPWLWLEPDAIPVESRWLDAIEAAYKLCDAKRPFMGVRVDFKGVIPHMSGVAVYPGNAPTLAPLLVTCNAVAFDVNGQSEVLPRLTPTTLIQHEWKPATFATEQDLERIRIGAVIYHQCKDGSLIERLRGGRKPAELEVGSSVLADKTTGEAGASGDTSAAVDLTPEEVIEEHVQQLALATQRGYSRQVGMYLAAAGLIPAAAPAKTKPAKKKGGANVPQANTATVQ